MAEMNSLLKFTFHQEALCLKSMRCNYYLLLYPSKTAFTEHFLLFEKSHTREFYLGLRPYIQVLSTRYC